MRYQREHPYEYAYRWGRARILDTLVAFGSALLARWPWLRWLT